jgi:hypothetical protein
MTSAQPAPHCETTTEAQSHVDGLGGQSDVLEATCRALMDASIAFEQREFARLRQGETA